MRKMFVFVVLAVLAMAVPANAQYIPQTWDGVYYRWVGNEAQMLVADNLGMVDGLTDQLRRAGYRSLAQDLYWNGAYGAYGLPMGRGGFYPMYDRNMRPMGRREATATYGAIGAGAGYAVFGNTRGTVAGAVVGGVVGLLTHRGQSNNQRDNGVIVTPPAESQAQPPVYWSNGAPVAVGTRLPGYPVQPEPEWQMLRNEFEGVTIYARVQGSDPNQPIIIPAGQTVTVQIPRGSQIWAEAQVCLDDSCTVQRWRQDVGRRPLPQGAGWVFYNPEEGR